LVTTNFDQHFTTAATGLFGPGAVDVYRGPALPLGSKFRGIVHLHGDVNRPQEVVLTDADFGAAYLADAWASRFLVDLFRTFTVLFVGYSHDDVVMTYLARALEQRAARFALTAESHPKWGIRGIQEIVCPRGPAGELYQCLYEGIEILATRSQRGALEWKQRAGELASQAPPWGRDGGC
jgi:hypothetical protein